VTSKTAAMILGSMENTITRPSFKFYGSGWTRASWTVGNFPSHDAYLEPCFGAGFILFHTRSCKLETVNDIDGRMN
jgi:site-specific DNA-adenine methylase